MTKPAEELLKKLLERYLENGKVLYERSIFSDAEEKAINELYNQGYVNCEDDDILSSVFLSQRTIDLAEEIKQRRQSK